jgi:hypothetical protein
MMVIAGLVLVLVIALAVTSATEPGGRWLRLIDKSWLGERVMDTMARLRTKEDWATARSLQPGQDYAWLGAGGTPVRIAHALGEAGTPTANTLAAARRAYEAGFRLFEVDLVQEGGELRCQHDPGPQGDLVKDGCTFDTLREALPPDTWLVLDIKKEFATVGQDIVDRVKGTEKARRLVFQLYRPEDFALFKTWQTQAALPGPILTAYLAHRRIDHVAGQAGRIGVRAFTMPLERLPSLTVRPVGAAVLVHPVHDCTSWFDALRRADGVYTLSRLRCGGQFPTMDQPS